MSKKIKKGEDMYFYEYIDSVLEDIMGESDFNYIQNNKDELYERPYNVSFGKLLGFGYFSAVFEIGYPYRVDVDLSQFKRPVMVITTEEIKPKLIESLASNSVVILDSDFFTLKCEEAKKEWEEYESEDPDSFFWQEYVGEFELLPFLSYIHETWGVTIYFMEYMEKVQMESTVEDLLVESMEELFRNFSGGGELISVDTIPSREDYTFSYLKEETLSNWVDNLKERGAYERVISEFEEAYNIAIESILKGGEVLKNLNSERIPPKIAIDIHKEQFLKISDKTVCVDPFTFAI